MIINELLRKWFNLEAPHCSSCMVLESQLIIANAERERLLSTMLEFTKPIAEEKHNVKDIVPIHTRALPWRVRQQMLEENDRAKAAAMRRAAEESAQLNDTVPNKQPITQEHIEEVERQLGIQ